MERGPGGDGDAPGRPGARPVFRSRGLRRFFRERGDVDEGRGDAGRGRARPGQHHRGEHARGCRSLRRGDVRRAGQDRPWVERVGRVGRGNVGSRETGLLGQGQRDGWKRRPGAPAPAGRPSVRARRRHLSRGGRHPDRQAPGAPPGGGAGPPPGRPRAPAGARDPVPFWGDWTGHVTVAFDQLRTDEHNFSHVGGAFDIGRGSIRMKGGRGGLDRHVLTNVDGSISFDAAAEFPYSVKAAAALGEIDAAPLFPPPQPGGDPVFEGHFSIDGTLAGKGINLDDLVGRTQAEFRLTSKAGIVRLLRANVAESLPEAPATVSDTLGTVGHAVGSVFGIRKESIGSAGSPLSKSADAVLNFTYQVSEIGCDEITVRATRGTDGTVRLADIEMTSPDEHLKGSGQITYVKGVPLFKQPLRLELEFGARGKVAELLSTAGLPSSRKDSLGYAMLNEPILFGGTLEYIDESRWYELLVKAATRKPSGGKKPAEGPAPKSS